MTEEAALVPTAEAATAPTALPAPRDPAEETFDEVEDELVADPDGSADADVVDAESPGEAERDADTQAGDAGDAGDPDADDADAEPDEPDEPEVPESVRRFAALVEERVRRVRYSHSLMRAVYTPEEAAVLASVDRRAGLWVPAFTLLALAGSAAAVLVLATLVGRDPGQQTGTAFAIVLATVVLLAGSLLTLFRSEVHFDRLRPRGRLVRTDVAEAYDVVRDAPRVFIDLGAEAAVVVRICDLLPAADQLIDALAEYHATGQVHVRSHPAYERILRMRAEVEVLARLMRETPRRVARGPVVRHDPSEPMPYPEQIAEYESLDDLVAGLEATLGA